MTQILGEVIVPNDFEGAKNKIGKIVRTGLIKDNPSEVAKEFAGYTNKGDLYIAMEFDHTIDLIPENID